MRKPILALLLGFPENAVIIRAVRQENMAYVEKGCTGCRLCYVYCNKCGYSA